MDMNTLFIINIKNNTKKEVKSFIELLYTKNMVDNKFDNYYHYDNQYLSIVDNHLHKINDLTVNYTKKSSDFKKYNITQYNNINHFLRYLKITKIKNKWINQQ